MRVFGKGQFKNFDWVLFGTILVICFLGLLAISNATADPFADADGGLLSRLNWYTVSLQFIWIVIGTVLVLLMQRLDYRTLDHYIKYIYIGLVAVLLLLLTVGKVSRGTQGWFKLIGDRTIQPAELGKIVLVVTLAAMITKKQEQGGINRFRDILPILAAFVIPFLLIMLQPDWGTAFVYAFIFFVMLFAARVSFKIIGGIIGCGLAAIPIAFFVFMQDWQRERILTFFDPSRDLSGSGLNVYYSKIAIGSGGFSGNGVFAEGGLSQLNFVPEKQTDFIFSATIEAVGFIGGLIILALYAFLLFRVLYLATQARDRFGFLIIFGVLAMETFHIFENIGMTMGLMPVTGIPLPFFSYGGSNMIANMLAFGLVLNVAKYRQSREPMELEVT